MTDPEVVLTNEILDKRLEQISAACTDIHTAAGCEGEGIMSATEPPISVAALSVAPPDGCEQ